MIFGLYPHIAPEKVDAEIERLEKEHGVAFKDKFTKIAYAPTYKPGDARRRLAREEPTRYHLDEHEDTLERWERFDA